MTVADPDAPPSSPPMRAAGGRRLPPWVAKAAFESALIVFSVFLALALDGWRDDAQKRRRVAEFRTAVMEELRKNRAELASDGFAPLHRRMLPAWGALSETPRPTAEDRNRTWTVSSTGMHPFIGRDVVWRSFGSSDLVQEMPSHEVFMLAEIYRVQDDIRALNGSFMNAALSISADADEPAYISSQAQVVRMLLSDITYAEARLLKLYDKALVTLPQGEPAASR